MSIQSDNKGYFDRECPNENCHFTFKVFMKDWKEKMADKEVHCPMCGHIDTPDKWYTKEQMDQIINNGAQYALSKIQEAITGSIKELVDSPYNEGFIKFTYNPEKRITFQNNPIGQREEWRNEITCEKCGTRYSVIGSAYFCPCCGHNSAVRVFNRSLDRIEVMIDSLPSFRSTLTTTKGIDNADDVCRDMLEGVIGDIVSAFQKYASCLYESISGKKVRVNDFQIIDKGSDLFKKITGKGYEEWLSPREIEILISMFQKRHLLEHNTGIVDQNYIDRSGDNSYMVGQRIVVKKNDVLEFLYIIKKLGEGLLSLKENPIQ